MVSETRLTYGIHRMFRRQLGQAENPFSTGSFFLVSTFSMNSKRCITKQRDDRGLKKLAAHYGSCASN